MPRTPPLLAFLILLAALLAGALLLRPRTRAVALQVEGLPAWGFVVARIGLRDAEAVDRDAQSVRFGAIRLGEHTIHLRGGVGADGACDRCCWSAALPLVVPRGKTTLGVGLRLDPAALTCPSVTLPYEMTQVAPGRVPALAADAEVRASLLLGQAPVDGAMWTALLGTGAPPTWEAALVLANRLSELEHLTPAYYHDEAHLYPFRGANGRPVYWMREASGYRLPTLAEAARAGTDALAWDAARAEGYAKPERVAVPGEARTAWRQGAVVRLQPDKRLPVDVPVVLARRMSSGYPAP